MLSKLIEQISSAQGYSSSLITYYVPADTDLWLSIDHLKQEQQSADNIKDRKNSKYVKKALTYAITYLQSLKQTPPTGVVLFSGEQWEYNVNCDGNCDGNAITTKQQQCSWCKNFFWM
jgi:peptide subunit release factor 1 (eRF1)